MRCSVRSMSFDPEVTLDEHGELSFESEEALSFYLNRVLSEHDTPSGPVWHYTGADGCVGIVNGSEVFATHYGFTNDTSELIRGEEILRRVVDELARGEWAADGAPLPDMVDDHRTAYEWLAYELPERPLFDRPPLYLACFTTAGGDAITQWSGYGSRGSGYALQLDVQRPDFQAMNPLSFTFVRVVYDEEAFAATVRRQLYRYANLYWEYKAGRGVLERVGMFMMRECAALSVRFKDGSFAHEQEWRIVAEPHSRKGDEKQVHFRARGNMIVPYVKVPIGRAVRGVVCGPAHAGEGAARLEAVRLLLESNGYDPDLAMSSKAPFRG
jgi:hypothetical protein